MKQETLFLKAAVILIGVSILALCLFLVPVIGKDFFEYFSWMCLPIFITVYLAAVPFFFALYQTIKLLGYIDENIAFSDLSVNAVKKIKICAVIICGLYAVCMPFLYLMAEFDDAPGLIVFGMVPVFGAIVIAVFAAVVQRLLQNAIDIKSENDLTV